MVSHDGTDATLKTMRGGKGCEDASILQLIASNVGRVEDLPAIITLGYPSPYLLSSKIPHGTSDSTKDGIQAFTMVFNHLSTS